MFCVETYSQTSKVVEVVAAILRAKVSRAKCGFAPRRRRIGESLGKGPTVEAARTVVFASTPGNQSDLLSIAEPHVVDSF
jgi:hypothetical protein